jgi:hypothetical protein
LKVCKTIKYKQEKLARLKLRKQMNMFPSQGNLKKKN